MPTPDFSKIFGTNATSTQNWSDSNYLTGWGFLGQAPPPYQLFDDYFKNTDTKLKWLYDNFGSIDISTAINTHNSDIESHPKLNFNILKRNKAYSIGDIAYSSTIPNWVQLECKTAGTTGATEPIWGTLTDGQEITDGTVVWKVSDLKLTQIRSDITFLGSTKQNSIKYIQIQDEKPSGTAGGTFASGAWRTRDLNTIKNDDTGLVSLSSNQITLPAGTYIFDLSSPLMDIDQNKVRLQNISDGETIFYGGNEDGLTNVMTRAYCSGKFTIATNKVIEVQHYTAYQTGIYGTAMSLAGVNEVYTVIKLWKVG